MGFPSCCTELCSLGRERCVPGFWKTFHSWTGAAAAIQSQPTADAKLNRFAWPHKDIPRPIIAILGQEMSFFNQFFNFQPIASARFSTNRFQWLQSPIFDQSLSHCKRQISLLWMYNLLYVRSWDFAGIKWLPHSEGRVGLRCQKASFRSSRFTRKTPSL